MSQHTFHAQVFDSKPAGSAAGLNDPYGSLTVDTVLKKRPKYTRSKTGCLTCRQKKVKCDEQKPGCARCAHSKRECEWPTVSSSSSRRRRTSLPTPSLSSSSTPSEIREESPRSAHGTEVGGSPQLPTPLSIPSSRDALHNKTGAEYYSSPQLSTPSVYFPPSPSSSTSPSAHSHESYSPPAHFAIPVTAAALPPPPEVVYVPAPSASPPQSFLYTAAYDPHILQQPLPPPQPVARPAMMTMPVWQAPLMDVSLPYAPQYYSSYREQQLMGHFLKVSLSHLVSMPPTDGTNPILALIQDCTVNQDSMHAHRFAMSAIASAHNTHMHYCKGDIDITLEREEVTQLRRAADCRLHAAVVSRQQLADDATLAATVMMVYADILLGESDWTDHLAIARDVVHSRGGVDALLSAMPSPTVSPWTPTMVVSPARLCLEMLVVFETFGCLTTGEEPFLLGEGTLMWHYLQSSQHTYDSFHVTSVETIFGFSRSLVLLVSKVSSILTQAAFTPELLVEGQKPSLQAPDFVHKLCANVMQVIYELDHWAPPVFPGQERVHIGNQTFRMALQILIFRDVYRVPVTDIRIQERAASIIQLVAEAAATRQTINLLWPFVIASCQTMGHMRADAVHILDEAFKYSYCFQYENVVKVLEEVWRRMDIAHPHASLREVCEDSGFKLLLL